MASPGLVGLAAAAAQRVFAPPRLSDKFANGPEARPNLVGKRARLFPGGEMSARFGSAVVKQLGIGPFGPTARRLVDLVRECADGDGELHAANVEEAALGVQLRGVPIKPSGGDRRLGEPIE